jgi:hypothetical protein
VAACSGRTRRYRGTRLSTRSAARIESAEWVLIHYARDLALVGIVIEDYLISFGNECLLNL